MTKSASTGAISSAVHKVQTIQTTPLQRVTRAQRSSTCTLPTGLLYLGKHMYHYHTNAHHRAKVDNAASASTSGQKWFKVFEDGLSGTTWGVDRMINNGGWVDFTMPSCVAPGQYLLRAEIIALHSASKSGGAQFYVGCAQIQVSGSGSKTGNTVSFPGAYNANDPGILVSIYNAQGQPVGNGQPYKIPGPAVLQC